MTSFSFPRMLNHTDANIISDKEAVRSNMLLLFSSEQESLFGDPYFGCLLKRYLFEQSNTVIVDLLIDTIYTAIITFIPQASISRKDIKIIPSRGTLYAEIRCYYALDNTSDLFTIQLTNNSNMN